MLSESAVENILRGSEHWEARERQHLHLADTHALSLRCTTRARSLRCAGSQPAARVATALPCVLLQRRYGRYGLHLREEAQQQQRHHVQHHVGHRQDGTQRCRLECCGGGGGEAERRRDLWCGAGEETAPRPRGRVREEESVGGSPPDEARGVVRVCVTWSGCVAWLGCV